MGEPEVAVVVGVGPGLGAALVLRFAKAGMNVALAARQLGLRAFAQSMAREFRPSGIHVAHVAIGSFERDTAAG
jgi:NAD(P)-dependent dehydrogenase (short-subunit alcohol dehydrogenase family)